VQGIKAYLKGNPSFAFISLTQNPYLGFGRDKVYQKGEKSGPEAGR
jgi:hypothetical protein